MKKNKYRAVKATVDGITFHSTKESVRYSELKLLERDGQIRGLELQPTFPITINGKHCFSWVGDFVYFEGEARIVEDVKSPITRKNRAYRIKKKCVEAQYSITIREV